MSECVCECAQCRYGARIFPGLWIVLQDCPEDGNELVGCVLVRLCFISFWCSSFAPYLEGHHEQYRIKIVKDSEHPGLLKQPGLLHACCLQHAEQDACARVCVKRAPSCPAGFVKFTLGAESQINQYAKRCFSVSLSAI